MSPLTDEYVARQQGAHEAREAFHLARGVPRQRELVEQLARKRWLRMMTKLLADGMPKPRVTFTHIDDDGVLHGYVEGVVELVSITIRVKT